MSWMTKTAGKLARILKDRSGNFAIASAVVLPVFLAAGGVAIDFAEMVMNKTRLQDATDAAALAASSAMAGKGATQAEAKLLAQRYLSVQMKADGIPLDDLGVPVDFASSTTVTITETAQVGGGKKFKVTVAGQIKQNFNAMTRLLGQKSVTLTAAATSESATESKNALSMYLVLDRSGSMLLNTSDIDLKQPSCYQYYTQGPYLYRYLFPRSPCYINKIAALKTSVANLFAQLNTADPTATLIRTGAVSFNIEADTPGNLGWGTTGALAYVNDLDAEGGTNSAEAFKDAYDKLMLKGNNSEEILHFKKNGQVPTKYIVFMTDGENNETSADTDTKKTCDLARKAGIHVYTIAFMAPTRGQNLLKYCATTLDSYFPAEDGAELIEAFKYIGQKTAALNSRLTN